MSDIGCLMTDPMMRAVLSNDKDVTRRIGKTWARAKVGDRLWFREVWASGDSWILGHECDPPKYVWYRADGVMLSMHGTRMDDDMMKRPTKWRSSLLMPRSVCRATGIITDIRQVPLQDIDEADAIREGMGTLTWADVVELAGLRKAIVLMSMATEGLVRDESTAMKYHNEASMRDRFWLGFSLIHSPEIWRQNPLVWRVEWRRE